MVKLSLLASILIPFCAVAASLSELEPRKDTCGGLAVAQGSQCIPICESFDSGNYTGDKRCGKNGNCKDTLCDVPLRSNCVRSGGCKINSIGLSIVKAFEQCCPTIYQIGGHPTLGWGHDCAANKETDCAGKYKPPISLPESYTILAKDLNAITAQVKSSFGVANLRALNTNHFSAILSFAFNAGAGRAHKQFGSYVTNKDFTGLCNAIYNSKIGDTGRRMFEGQLCKTATSDPTGC